MSSKRPSNGTQENAPKKAKTGHWSLGLKASMEDPELIVEFDEKIVIIKDKYPKAKHHYLILPKENVPNLKSLKKEHLPLLKHMKTKADEMVEKFSSNQFQIGYHAVPSMSHLHLHVISRDFDSPCLKTKTHWNSFTTEYFINSDDVVNQLETQGIVKTMDPAVAKELLKNPLRCHVCKSILPNIPKLKSHITKCK
ncbi:hypothetical protein JTE90_004574 [Oedothorax gibbosus]|uniref:Aprataxin C2HE/C2H2/C2HC zinc finger domain-containing protein n=1 Tax=Oedothorax gibbosus TaxID=931172 RepID=A0AAV6UJ43_9ARAC|nr:hypothetical protein JTE90_004574 [Oedothorax gibbosus]